MIFLEPEESLRAILAASSSDVHAKISLMDYTSSPFDIVSSPIVDISNSYVTLVEARDNAQMINSICVVNRDSVSHTLSLEYMRSGGVSFPFNNITLSPGYALHYENQNGWSVLNAYGAKQ